ncbi:PREDICTED: complement factor H-related protein 2-like, partial [Miniopterus natalensis]|uniref:complement factor H-related protein 2-like n=1 Tax=Miniopterus natalensis TaxID=291302 RepID=UPI0007A6EEE5
AERKCGPPPHIDSGDITILPLVVYALGSSVENQCQSYYVLQRNRKITCSDGTWSEPPKCLHRSFHILLDSEKIYAERKCGPPPHIDSGDITILPLVVYALGSSVENQCQSYYVLQRNRKITCSDGTWSEPPKCLHRCVVKEETLKKYNIHFKWSGEKILYSTSGDHVEFVCRPGYDNVSPLSAFR